MDLILDKPIVLSLNTLWQAIGWKSVRQAISAMNATKNGEDMAAYGIDVNYQLDENGDPNMNIVGYYNPIKSWEEWAKLPIRDWDLTIPTARELIRVPTIVIARDYKQMPKKRPKLSNEAIRRRDGGIDQYTGKPIPRDKQTVDHIIPKKVWRDLGLEGSPNTWENMALAEAELNHRKGHKLNEELGLTLIRTPKAPPVTVLAAWITESRHADHEPFLVKNMKSDENFESK